MNNEQPRPVANSDEHNYTLTIEETADRYEQAGFPRTHRAIQKYCAVSKLDCRKIETEFGEKYLVAPYSIERHIAYIRSIKPMNNNTNVREQTRIDANVPSPIPEPEQPRMSPANSHERPRPVANVPPPPDDRYTASLEKQITFLQDQILVKDTQIKNLTEHSQQTNVLMQSFQRLLAPLLGSGEMPDKQNSHESPGQL